MSKKRILFHFRVGKALKDPLDQIFLSSFFLDDGNKAQREKGFSRITVPASGPVGLEPKALCYQSQCSF